MHKNQVFSRYPKEIGEASNADEELLREPGYPDKNWRFFDLHKRSYSTRTTRNLGELRLMLNSILQGTGVQDMETYHN